MVERTNRTLVDIYHYLLQAKDLLTIFFAEVIYYANYLMNLVLTCAVSSMTLTEKWCGNKSSLVTSEHSYVLLGNIFLIIIEKIWFLRVILVL